MRLFAFPPSRRQLRSSRIQLLLEQNENKRGGRGGGEKKERREGKKGRRKKKKCFRSTFFYDCNSPGMIPTRVGNIDGGVVRIIEENGYETQQQSKGKRVAAIIRS